MEKNTWSKEYPYDQFDSDKTVYGQDCEFYRYQDKQRWSRFQTIIVVEGAWLGVIFGAIDLSKVNLIGNSPVHLFGFLLVYILCLLSIKDEVDANKHMDRLSTMERYFWDRNIHDFDRAPSHYSTGDRILYPVRGILPSGSTLTVVIVFLINLFNILVLLRIEGVKSTLWVAAVLVFFWIVGWFLHLLEKKQDKKTAQQMR